LARGSLDKLALKVTATNLTDKLYLTGFENSLAGTRYGSPRQFSVQAQYKFHY
jgi:outer membrane receptor for ferric coprogen and ferric-rhodotorulic acid